MTLEELKNIPTWTRFIAIGQTDEKVRCCKESDENIFVFRKRAKRCGHRYNLESFLKYYTPIIESEEDKEKKWHKKCRMIEKRLEKSGLWPEMKVFFHNLQQMSLSDREDIDTLYWSGGWTEAERKAVHNQIRAEYEGKYPFIFREDGSFNSDYIGSLSDAKTKSMYFGPGNKFVKADIQVALNCKTNKTVFRRAGYDVTFEYNAEKNKAWYQEEYRDCGNGHYYMAIDGSCALFVEND